MDEGKIPEGVLKLIEDEKIKKTEKEWTIIWSLITVLRSIDIN